MSRFETGAGLERALSHARGCQGAATSATLRSVTQSGAQPLTHDAIVERKIERYPWALILVHWVMALLILLAMPIGYLMGELEPGWLQDLLYHVHRSLGVTLLALAVVRSRCASSWASPRRIPLSRPGSARFRSRCTTFSTFSSSSCLCWVGREHPPSVRRSWYGAFSNSHPFCP